MKQDIDSHIDLFLKQFANRRICIAVSGGIDSMVLLNAVQRAHNNVLVLHMNYHLRDNESDEDEKFVFDRCNELEIPIEVRHSDLKALSLKGKSVQAKARKERYNWFQEYIDKGDFILLGHHQDDQIETFYLNLVRAGGVMGLSGMVEINGHFLRPLLPFSRKEILDYAVINKVKYREDSSNSSLKYWRNVFRQKLIPEMNSGYPALKVDTLTLITVFQENQERIERKILPLSKSLNDSNELRISDWNNLDDTEKIELLRQLNLPFSALNEIGKLTNAQKGARITLNSVTLYKESDAIYFGQNDGDFIPKLSIEENAVVPKTYNKEELYLDKEKIQGELVVRKWRIGDRMKPIGVNGSKLVSDIITNAKIPNHERANVLVVHDNREIHWVVGIKVGKIAIATEKTSCVLKLTVELL